VSNWFLALGLLLSLKERLGDGSTSHFFLSCVAVAGFFGLFSVGPIGGITFRLL
jgi:uncharacterized membrane protein